MKATDRQQDRLAVKNNVQSGKEAESFMFSTSCTNLNPFPSHHIFQDYLPCTLWNL